MPPFIRNITFDASDPERLANFWAAALEWELRDGFVMSPSGAPRLNFERVPESKTVKNRVHLDINADDREGYVQRLMALGARKELDVEDASGEYSWTVMLDPEGNEFCVVDLPPP
jgi:predicted enzyme related to lactoylglutathione lyase